MIIRSAVQRNVVVALQHPDPIALPNAGVQGVQPLLLATSYRQRPCFRCTPVSTCAESDANRPRHCLCLNQVRNWMCADTVEDLAWNPHDEAARVFVSGGDDNMVAVVDTRTSAGVTNKVGEALARHCHVTLV